MRNTDGHFKTNDFSMSVDEWEQEWRRSQQRYTNKELLEIFSPPAEMIQANFKKYTEKYHPYSAKR